MAQQQFFLGIDGGGTKCKARLENANGDLLAEGLAGPSNPVQNADLAFQSILDAASEAVNAAGIPGLTLEQLSVCLGLAGVNVPAYRSIAEKWSLPFKNVKVTTDLHVACVGAHGSPEGAIVITGTGSSSFACVNNVHTGVGGHGFPLGDKGSGAWMGWRGLNYTLEVLDKLQPPTPMVHALCRALGTDNTREIVGEAIDYASRDFARLAPVVVNHVYKNDPVATAIMEDGKAYLEAVILRLKDLGAKRISIIGGLSGHWTGWFAPHIQQLLSPALNPPEIGAVVLARQAFKEA
ncbi:BadF/BadG/BcrA/BcrD ATPase family protein [Alteromonas sp. C1M14]|uniref:BadF/BadG/BcrA/BcrD ATPase family protein n=1 Tax=Alteromonas sp. C1M14 TaxID=2841567 RepID=UPI001C09DCDA|nr:ATPase [Alteromonas sp. C1M14]